jgi:hypothetical protein
MRERIVPPDPWFRSPMSVVTLEVGALLLLDDLGLAFYAFDTWGAEGFGELAYAETMRLVIPSSTAILFGFQIIYSAFSVSILEIRLSLRRRDGARPFGRGSLAGPIEQLALEPNAYLASLA